MSRERGIAFPTVCLTCGYSAVPGKSFDAHECIDFRALPIEDQAANKRASWAWMVRRMERAGMIPNDALRRMAGLADIGKNDDDLTRTT